MSLLFPARRAALAATVLALVACGGERATLPAQRAKPAASAGPMKPATIASGQTIFRQDTYGDESCWTDTRKMHEVIQT